MPLYMIVYVAEEAGFCFGVRRALETIDELYEKNKDIHIFGQLIHNRSVLEKLRARGIDCIDSLSQRDPKKKLIIRTHGIPIDVEEQLTRDRADVVDATCPLVKKLHRIAAQALSASNSGTFVVIGDPKHPEIIAAASYAPGAIVISSIEEARQLTPREKMTVMVQTTFDVREFNRIKDVLEEKATDLHVYNTICNATVNRQEAVRKLAPNVDFMIVLGGKNSSNTKKLYNIARQLNPNSYHVESYEELTTHSPDLIDRVSHFQTVGITAGASTPPEEITKTKEFFRNINSNTVKEI